MPASFESASWTGQMIIRHVFGDQRQQMLLPRLLCQQLLNCPRISWAHPARSYCFHQCLIHRKLLQAWSLSWTFLCQRKSSWTRCIQSCRLLINQPSSSVHQSRLHWNHAHRIYDILPKVLVLSEILRHSCLGLGRLAQVPLFHWHSWNVESGNLRPIVWLCS